MSQLAYPLVSVNSEYINMLQSLLRRDLREERGEKRVGRRERGEDSVQLSKNSAVGEELFRINV